MATKHKHRDYKTKVKAIEAVDNGLSKTAVAGQFSIPLSTLSTWLKNREQIQSTYDKHNPSRKRQRTGLYEEVDKALMMWVQAARGNNIPISGVMLKAKACELSQKLGRSDFKASNGWFDRFKHRCGLSFHAMCGESSAVGEELISEWQSKTLPDLLSKFETKDVFNADETGLFYRLLPDKTWSLKGDTCHGGKKSKDRLSVMVAANMDGTEKLPLLVIGKSAKPRCFKNVQTLPTIYRNNKKAWMTSMIFEEWVRDLDKQYMKKKRHVALVIDNCTAHPHLNDLKAITLVYLPPNTTSKTQPMDQGIIKNLKVHYREGILRKLLASVDKKEVLYISVLDALHGLRQAWDLVKPQTIKNCFRHCQFTTDASVPGNDETLSDDIAEESMCHNLWEHLPQSEISLSDFIQVDDHIMATAPLTDDDIVASVQKGEQEDETEDTDDTDDPLPPPPPSSSDAAAAISTLRAYLETCDGSTKLFTNLSEIDRFVLDQHLKVTRQSKISDFFAADKSPLQE